MNHARGTSLLRTSVKSGSSPSPDPSHKGDIQRGFKVKSILIAASLSFGIVFGGYFTYLKLSVNKGAGVRAETVTVKKEDVEAIEFGLRALNRNKIASVEMEARLKAMRSDIGKEKAELLREVDKLQERLDALIKTQNELGESEERSMRKLAKMYELMKPKDAAEIASNLSDDLLVRIIERMKEKAAAKLISAMDTSKAVRISKLLSGIRKK